MKPILLILALFVATLAAGSFTGCGGYDRELLGDPQPEPAQQIIETPEESQVSGVPDSLDVGMFSDLKFYGSWYQLEPFGWVWRPIVISDWAPFSEGHWVWTSYGWMWISYEPFGWATYHYGYWTNDFTLGWVWIPDYQWSPCQCEWTLYDDYVCWAPVPPPGVRFKDPWDSNRTNPWVTVRAKNFVEPEIGRYKEPAKFKAGTSDRTLRRSPPDSRDIERIRGKELTAVDVSLQRTVVGDKEFARVTLPPDQQRLVDEHQARTKNPSNPPAVTGPPPNDPPKAKSEKSKSTSDAKTGKTKESSKPQPYKQKGSEEKSKEKDDDSKSGEKSKGKPAKEKG